MGSTSAISRPMPPECVECAPHAPAQVYVLVAIMIATASWLREGAASIAAKFAVVVLILAGLYHAVLYVQLTSEANALIHVSLLAAYSLFLPWLFGQHVQEQIRKRAAPPRLPASTEKG